MSKIRALLLGLLGLALTATLLVGIAPSQLQSAPEPVVAVVAAERAEAGTLPTRVFNLTGAVVKIDCNYKQGPYKYLYEKYPEPGSYSSAFCKDPDRVESPQDPRCINYVGLGHPDGNFYMEEETWFKIASLSKVSVFAYTPKGCSKSKPFKGVKDYG